MSKQTNELKDNKPLDRIELSAEISQRLINAKTLADGLFDAIMDEPDVSDTPLSLTIMLQEQLDFLGNLIENI